MNKRKAMTIEQKNAWIGRVFILPWLIGFIFLFSVPMVQAIYYTLNKITLTSSGFQFTFIGFQNYMYAFTQDPDFVRALWDSIKQMLYQVPIIVFFSLFVAIILHDDFKGRTLARAIFFLPVIIASGVVIQILKENILSGSIGSTETVYMFGSSGLRILLLNAGLSPAFVGSFTGMVNSLFDITWKTGVQILLFMAALNAIPASSYEVADIEGATGWEKFWKITFPMVSPTILVTIIYSIIDSFTDYGNKVMRMIYDTSNTGKYEYGSTMAIVYFLCVLVIIGIVTKLISNKIFYAVE